MPKKSKGKFKPLRINRNNHEAEIFRNTSAVLDDTDPFISLQYMKDIFRERLDEDVITMIFSECAYNVDQALETLESLCNDETITRSTENKNVCSNKQTKEGSSNDSFNSYASAYVSNVSKSPNKSKLAIKFSPPTDNLSFNSTNESEIIAQDFQFESELNIYSSCSKYVQNQASFMSNPVSSIGTHTQKWGNIFSPTYCNISETSKLSDNSDTVLHPVQEKSSRIDPQFVTPIYNFNKFSNFDANASFQGGSRKFHTSPDKNNHMRKDERKIKEALKKITSGAYVLVILRGLPGSGKSTLARKLKFSGEVFSTDDFFINKQGEYVFDPYKLSEAHAWNKHRTKQALEKGVTPVIIDNTNVEAWEITPYVLLGKKFNYEIIILEPDTPWKFNVHELSKRNKHSILKSKIFRMKEKYQHNVTTDKILASINLLNSKNIDTFLGDSDLNKTVIKNVEGSIVDILTDNSLRNNKSVTVDIHQEETPTDNMLFNVNVTDSISQSNTSLLRSGSPKIVEDSEASGSKSYLNENNAKIFENSIADQSVDAFNLDKLLALAQEDSEDSTSVHSSVNGSTLDVSGWEAITEHDDDFLWSTNSENIKSDDVKKYQVLEVIDHLNYNDPQYDVYNSSGLCMSQTITDIIQEESDPKEALIHQHQVRGVLKSNCTIYNTDVSAVEKMKGLKNESGSASWESKEKLWIECDVNEPQAITKAVSEESELKEAQSDPYQVRDFLKSLCSMDKTKISLLEEVNEVENQSGSPTWESKQKLWIECDIDDESILKLSKEDSSLSPNNLTSTTDPLLIDESSSKISDKDLIIQAKPQRSSLDYSLNFNRDNFNDASLHAKNVDFSISESESDWNITETPVVDKDDANVSNNINVDAAPKPQREIFENNASFTNLINSSDLPKKKASLLNISVHSIDCDWSFPDYTTPCIEEEKNHVKQISNVSAYSQTEPSDFIISHKVTSGCVNSNFQNFKILNASPYKEGTLYDIDFKPVFSKKKDYIAQIATFDKSTKTDDLAQDLEMCKKLDHLQDCFPDIAVDDLHHLLDICHNDETWISNLLLEWGYKYNVQKESYVNDKNLTTSSFNEKNSNAASSDNFSNLFKTRNQPVEVNESSSLTKSEVEPNYSGFKKLQLVLDPGFASQLQQIFGPVGSLDSEDDRCVDIDMNIAELLYMKWKESISETRSKSKTSETKVSNLSYLKIEREEKKKDDLITKDPKDLTLSEIMDMEYAIQLHKQEKLKKDTDFATKLKRLELYNMFPGADTMALDEIFESNNYSLKDTVFALGEDIGQVETVQKQQNQKVEQIDQRLTEWSNKNVFKEFEQGDWSDWVYQEENIGNEIESSWASSDESVTISLEALKLRDLAANHYQLRQQFIGKAQNAYCRGMKDVASFYAQKGTEHGQLFKEANKNASLLIAQQRNTTSSALVIDLHGLYIQEAIPLLEKFMREKKKDISQRKQTTPITISIITGQGLHSMKGPKLRPSVIEYLKKTGYNFYEINRGMVEVTITPEISFT